MDNIFCWYKWSAGIISNSTAGCKIWRNFQSRCPSPAQMCHVTPWACAQDTPLGEMASFCLLILEEKRNWENEFVRVIWCMFRGLHSNRTNAAKKTDFTSLKCIQCGPIEGFCWLILLLFCEWTILNLFGEGVASVSVEKMYQNERKRAKLNWKTVVGIHILRWAQHFRFFLIPYKIIHCQEKIYIFILKENSKRLEPSVRLKILTYSENIQEILCLADVLLAESFQTEKRVMSFLLQMALCVL